MADRKLNMRNIRNKIPIIIGLLVTFILFLFVGIFIFEKHQARSEILEVKSSLVGQGELVLDDANDAGCRANDLGFIMSQTLCTYQGREFYKNNKEIKADLQDLDKQLTLQGYALRTTTQYSSSLNTFDIDNVSSRTWVYVAGNRPVVHLVFFRPLSGDRNVEKKLNIPFKDTLRTGEYVFGIRLQKTYQGFYHP